MLDFRGFKTSQPTARPLNREKTKWEAFFYIYQGKNKRAYRFSKGVNDKPLPHRKGYAEVLAQTLLDGLRSGWDPTRETFPNFIKTAPESSEMPFLIALDFALEKKKPFLRPASLYDYKGTVRFMTEAAKDCGLDKLDIRQVKRKDIRLIVATAKESRSWSNNARNKYLTILQSLLSVLVEEEIIEHNPAHKIKQEPTTKGLGFRSATEDEKERILLTLMDTVPDFFDYVLLMWATGIRRKESLMITGADVNLAMNFIRVRSEVAKTNRERTVAFPAEVKEMLERRVKVKKEFIFSLDFKPGTKQLHPNTATNWWKKFVQKPLKTDLKLYGMKHTGADDKIRAGISIDVLKNLYGHRSQQMTENYAKAVKQQYNQIIVDQSPTFISKVVKMKREG